MFAIFGDPGSRDRKLRDKKKQEKTTILGSIINNSLITSKPLLYQLFRFTPKTDTITFGVNYQFWCE